ncbi:MAG: CPXCG motif-containing cysteine-rich protein [Planctomycetes bacterium]|jgi:hypothetical protein|nr:CPXCG motif-containing cysteine-rich protein [Planctomycetota bacterium]
MSAEEEAFYLCPACGEEIGIPVDLSGGSEQEYVEDCPVCCRPVLLRIHIHGEGGPTITAQTE